MRARDLLSVGVTSLILTAVPAHSTVQNGSFETGDLSGWQGGISVNVVSTAGNQTAVKGNRFALLTPHGSPGRTHLGQSIQLDAADTLSGWAFYREEPPEKRNETWMSTSWVVVKSGGLAGPVVATVFSANDNTEGWRFWKFRAPSAGTYAVDAFARAVDRQVEMGIDGFAIAKSQDTQFCWDVVPSPHVRSRPDADGNSTPGDLGAYFYGDLGPGIGEPIEGGMVQDLFDDEQFPDQPAHLFMLEDGIRFPPADGGGKM